jgi:hypothetical protein
MIILEWIKEICFYTVGVHRNDSAEDPKMDLGFGDIELSKWNTMQFADHSVIGNFKLKMCHLLLLFRPTTFDGERIFPWTVCAEQIRNSISFAEQGYRPCVQPQPGGPGLCIYVPPVTVWPRYTARHRVPISSASATHTI